MLDFVAMWRTLFALVLLLLGFSYMPAVHAQTSGITSPSPGQTVSGIVVINGTATNPTFLRYEVAFLREESADAGWIPFADGDQQVVNGTLAVWDTTVGQNVNAPVFPDGVYQLRLRVVRADYNYDEYFVSGLRVVNNSVLPQPTPVPTNPPLPSPTPFATEAQTQPVDATAEVSSPTPPPTPTPLLTRVPPTLVPTSDLQVATLALPDELPTLTPFPTPTPQATPENQRFTLLARNDSDDSGDSPGIIESIFGFNYGAFGGAFARGFRLTLLLFALLGVYLLARTMLRGLWRLMSSLW